MLFRPETGQTWVYTCVYPHRSDEYANGSLYADYNHDFCNVCFAADAARHGYRFEFHLFPTHEHIAPAWCRMIAMERILSTGPAAVLYLDQDVYIKTDLPLSLKDLRDSNKSRCICMNEYHPHPYDETNGGFSVYSRLSEEMGGAPTAVSRDMPMPELQRMFESHPAFTQKMYKNDMLNTGGGWLELGHARGSHGAALSRSFLHQWWGEGKVLDGGKWLLQFTWEQRVLSVTMAKRQSLRMQTLLLPDKLYNSPVSLCMPHMYGEYKRVGSYVAEALRTFRESSMPFLNRLTARVVVHTQYEMVHLRGE